MIWAGWLLDPNELLRLVLDEDSEMGDIVRLFTRTGLASPASEVAFLRSE